MASNTERSAPARAIAAVARGAIAQLPESLSLTPKTPTNKLLWFLCKEYMRSPKQQATLAVLAASLYALCEVRAYFAWRSHLRSVSVRSDRSEVAAGDLSRLQVVQNQTDPVVHQGDALRCSADSFRLYLHEVAAGGGRDEPEQLTWQHFYSCVLCFFGLNHERALPDDQVAALLGIVDNFAAQEGLARPPSTDPSTLRRMLGREDALAPEHLPPPVVAYGQCPIKASYKPLPVRWAFRAALSAMDAVARLGLGYERHWVAIPEGYVSFLVRQHRRPRRRSTSSPSSSPSSSPPALLFIHGIGLGALPHLLFFEQFRDRTLILMELPNSGHWHYQQENASPSSIRSALRELFTRLDLPTAAPSSSSSTSISSIPSSSSSSSSSSAETLLSASGDSAIRKVPSLGSLTSNTGNFPAPSGPSPPPPPPPPPPSLPPLSLSSSQSHDGSGGRRRFVFDAMGHSLGTDFVSMSLVMPAHASSDLEPRRLVLLDPICFPVEMLLSHRAPFWTFAEMRRLMPRLPLPIAWAALHWVVRDVHTQQACFRTLNSDACLLTTRNDDRDDSQGSNRSQGSSGSGGGGGTVAMPTLVCLGGKDVVVPAYDIERYLRVHQPTFEVHMEHEAGHGDFLEHLPSHPRTRRVVDRIKAFLVVESVGGAAVDGENENGEQPAPVLAK